MPIDRLLIQLATAAASNTGQAFAGGAPTWGAWDSRIVPVAGTIRTVAAVADALASNTRVNRVDIYNQTSGSTTSNTSTSVLTAPISLGSNSVVTFGVVSQAGARVAAGDQLTLKTDSVGGATLNFVGLRASITIEPD